MSSRVCRCVTCPACHTRYAMRSTPYPNGAHLASDPGAINLFTLHCACGHSYLFSLSQLQTYVLTESAYSLGYGSPAEIVPTRKAASLL